MTLLFSSHRVKRYWKRKVLLKMTAATLLLWARKLGRETSVFAKFVNGVDEQSYLIWMNSGRDAMA